MRGERRVMLFIEGDDQSMDIRAYVMRDTPLGMTELELKKDWALFGSDEPDPAQWLKDALVTVIEGL